MTDLVTWLREQLDEDEDDASGIHTELCTSSRVRGFADGCDCGWPPRVLAEVDAKRAILGEIFRYEAKVDGEWGCCCSADHIAAGRCPETSVAEITALRWLALPYADRPGYDLAWRPESIDRTDPGDRGDDPSRSTP